MIMLEDIEFKRDDKDLSVRVVVRTNLIDELAKLGN